MHPISPASLFRVILCRPSHPGNIGGVARAMKNMGLHQLILVQPLCEITQDAYARASGAGSVLDEAIICPSLPDALHGCVDSFGFTSRRRERIARLYSLRDAVSEAYKKTVHGPVAFVFGNETNGLTIEELAACQSMAYIPANPEYASLNLAAAVQLLSYELYVAQPEAPTLNYQPVPAVPARHHQVTQMMQSLEGMLLASGFLDPANPKQLMARLQRFMHRSQVEEEEVHLLTGIFETVRKRLSASSSKDKKMD